MANSREHFALDWIKGELLETLNDARQALEAFVESDRDETRMRACLTGLHQVHGTLVMLELSGVTLLADHLEQLAQKMLSQETADEQGAAQVLMQGILELPGHLEEIQAGGADTASGVGSLVNDIRAHLGEAPLSFDRDVASIARSASAESLDRFQEIDGAEKTRKIRAAYQQVLLSILKGEAVSGSVPMLTKVARSLQRVCQGTPHEHQWEAFGEFVVSLEDHDGPLEGQSVKLLRRVDSEIRALGQNGVGSLKEPVSLALVGELLDAAAQRQHENEVTARLRAEIASAGDDTPVVSPSGRQALSSAAAALREELLLVKDQLDLIVRAGGDASAALANLIAPLKQIGSTLSLLGFESSKSIIGAQVDLLNDTQEGEPLDQAALISIASALVQVDENLASFSHGGKDEAEQIFDSAQKAVTVEARQGLDQVKQDVVDFISSEWDPRHLKETAERITSICGALDMIPLPRASNLLGNCGRYVASALAGGHTPTWQEMDLFADAISGIDYYLERIGEASSFGVEDVLDLVARSLEGLDVPAVDVPVADAAQEDAGGAEASAPEVAGTEAAEAEVSEAEAQEAPEAAAPALGEEPPVDLPGDLDEEEEEPKLEMDDDPGFDLSGSEFDTFGGRTEDEDPVEAEATAGNAEMPPLPDAEEDVRSLGDVLAESEEAELDALADEAFEAEAPAEAAVPEIEAGVPAADSADPAPVEELPEESAPVARLPAGREPVVDPSLADSFESDDEIVEIFVEEVDEVLETVDEWLPQWRLDLAHEEALSEVRRAFHTLKGSGRIVGANVIGELAWSVENMLNRLIDGTVEPGAQFPSVVDQARTLVPKLKDAFETRSAPDMTKVALIMEMADILASGGSLDDAAAEKNAGAPIELADEMVPDEAVRTPAAEESESRDESLDIFVGEARGHLAVLGNAAAAEGVRLDDAVLRALHTLSGSAGMADFRFIEELARPTYELASALRESAQDTAAGESGDYLKRAFAAMERAVEALAAGASQEDHLQLIAEADHLIVAAGEMAAAGEAPSRSEMMALEALNDLMSADDFLRSWKDGAMDLAFADRLIEALTEIRDAAVKHEAAPLADLAHAFAGALTRLADETLSESLFNALGRGLEGLLKQFDALAAEQSLESANDLVAMLDSLGYGSAYADDDLGGVDVTGEMTDDDEGADNVVAFPAESRGDQISLDDIDDDLLREGERDLTEENLAEEDLGDETGPGRRAGWRGSGTRARERGSGSGRRCGNRAGCHSRGGGRAPAGRSGRRDHRGLLRRSGRDPRVTGREHSSVVVGAGEPALSGAHAARAAYAQRRRAAFGTDQAG